jgi:subtilase family serine protease
VIACADDGNILAESDETNNCRRSDTKIKIFDADYTVTSVSNPPATGAPGDTFPILDTTTNSGASSSTTTATNFYLSLDKQQDGGDVVLGGRGLLGLASGASSSGGLNAHIPDMPSGKYYAIACADASNLIPESSETNNCTRAATKIKITNPE